MNLLDKFSKLKQLVLEVLRSIARTRSGLIMVLLGAATAVAGCLTLMVAVEYLVQSRGLSSTTGEVASNAPMEFDLPTHECPPEGLKLGERSFVIQAVSLSPEALLPAAPTRADLAYRVEGVGEKQVFLLGLEAGGGENAGLGVLTQTIYNDDSCNIIIYRLSAAQPVQVSNVSPASLVQAEMVVLIQTGADGSGLALYGNKISDEMNLPAASTPGASQVQAEIKVLHVRLSDVAQILQVKVSVYNYGDQALELTAEDMGLLVEGGTSLGPLGAKPAFPETIRPGETQELEVLFTKPAQGLGVLRVYSVEIDLAYVEE